MADREEESMFVIVVYLSVQHELTPSFTVSEAQAQEEEQLENKIINEGY